MSVPEVEEINISCEAGMEESFPGAAAPKNRKKRQRSKSRQYFFHFRWSDV